MVPIADSAVCYPQRIEFKTPIATRAVKLAFSLSFLAVGVILSGCCAFTVYLLAFQLGAPPVVACVPACAASLLFFLKGLQIVIAPIRFKIVLEPSRVSIGSGWLRRIYVYDEVEAISLPENNEGHGVALEGGTRGAFVHLNSVDEMACAQLLRSRCRNAIFVDHSGREYLPPTPDQPLMAIGTLYRRNRGLALGTIVPIVFLGALCGVEAILLLLYVFGLTNQGIQTSDVIVIALKFCAELAGLIWLVRFGSRRMKMTLLLREELAEIQRKNAEARQ